MDKRLFDRTARYLIEKYELDSAQVRQTSNKSLIIFASLMSLLRFDCFDDQKSSHSCQYP